MKRHLILAVHIHNRLSRVPGVQKILSEYGCNIRTRLGLHEASETECSPNGLILLELAGDVRRCAALEKKLKKLQGVEVKKIVFGHP